MSLFTTDDYLRALQALISSGRAWTRDPKAVQAAVLRTLGASFQRSDNDAQALLRGAFPKTATIMLTEREKTLGLPDDCSIGEVDTIAKRQNAIVSKLFYQYCCRDGLCHFYQRIPTGAGGLSYCGDPLRSWGNRQLECRIIALAPSYTLVKFSYIYFRFNDEGVYDITPEFSRMFDIASGYIP